MNATRAHILTKFIECIIYRMYRKNLSIQLLFFKSLCRFALPILNS